MAHETLDNGEHHQGVLYFIELPNHEPYAASVALESIKACESISAGDSISAHATSAGDSISACESVNACRPVGASLHSRLSSPPSAVIVESLAANYDSFPVVQAEEIRDQTADVPSQESFDVIMPGLVLAPDQEEISTVDVETSMLKADMSSELQLGLEGYIEDGRKASHLLDHMYSVVCKPNCCRCGGCGVDKPEAEPSSERSAEQTQIRKEDIGGSRPGYKCNLCGYSASRRQHVKQHMATHLQEKPFKCNLCDYSASQKQSLVAHALRFHINRKPFKCDLCDYSAFRKQHVVVHMGKHMKTKPFKCDECEFETSWKEYLGVHKKNLHPPSKTFKPWCE